MTVALAHGAGKNDDPAARVHADARAFPAAAVEAEQREAARRRHAAHVGIGCHPDAAVAALGAQLIALVASGVVIDGFHRLDEAALIIAAVINRGGSVIGSIRKVGGLNEITPAHFDLIEIEVTGDRVDRPFGDVCPLGPAISAIGVNRHGVRHHYPGARGIVLDLVGAGSEIDRVNGGTA